MSDSRSPLIALLLAAPACSSSTDEPPCDAAPVPVTWTDTAGDLRVSDLPSCPVPLVIPRTVFGLSVTHSLVLFEDGHVVGEMFRIAPHTPVRQFVHRYFAEADLVQRLPLADNLEAAEYQVDGVVYRFNYYLGGVDDRTPGEQVTWFRRPRSGHGKSLPND